MAAGSQVESACSVRFLRCRLGYRLPLAAGFAFFVRIHVHPDRSERVVLPLPLRYELVWMTRSFGQIALRVGERAVPLGVLTSARQRFAVLQMAVLERHGHRADAAQATIPLENPGAVNVLDKCAVLLRATALAGCTRRTFLQSAQYFARPLTARRPHKSQRRTASFLRVVSVMSAFARVARN